MSQGVVTASGRRTARRRQGTRERHGIIVIGIVIGIVIIGIIIGIVIIGIIIIGIVICIIIGIIIVGILISIIIGIVIIGIMIAPWHNNNRHSNNRPNNNRHHNNHHHHQGFSARREVYCLETPVSSRLRIPQLGIATRGVAVLRPDFGAEASAFGLPPVLVLRWI